MEPPLLKKAFRNTSALPTTRLRRCGGFAFFLMGQPTLLCQEGNGLTSAGVIDFEIACLRQSPEIIRLCAPHTLISQHIWQHSCASQFCMTRLKDKIENGLNEGCILLLGGQVLIGAGFRTIFTDGFEK